MKIKDIIDSTLDDIKMSEDIKDKILSYKSQKKYFILKPVILGCVVCVACIVFIIKNYNVENTPIVDNEIPISVENTDKYEEKEIAFYEGGKMYSWAVDPTIPNNLIGGNSVIVKFKVLSIGDAKFLPRYPKFYTYEPFTPIEVEISDVFFGEEISGKFTIYKNGGIVTVRDMVEYLPIEMMTKRGFTNMSIEEQENTYVKYTDEYDYDLKVGEEYVCIIGKAECEDNIYIISHGYCIFIEDNGIYKNVLTGNILDITNI